MKMFTAIALTVLFALPMSADTVDLKALITEKLLQQKKLADMNVERKAIDDEKQNLDAQTAKNKKVENELKKRATEWSMDNDQNEGRKQRALSSGCRPGEKTTDTALARRCNEEAAKINAETDRLQKEGGKLLADKSALEKAEAQLTKDSEAWSVKKKHNGAAIDDLNRRIAGLTKYLSGHCTSIPTDATDEKVKHACGNVQFDGAAPTLPPWETQECKAAETLFGRQAQH
jgi:hypothetical protein